MKTLVLACIDGSTYAPAVCDAAAWAALRLEAPLTFLHVLSKTQEPRPADLSGSLGLGARESLLEELAELDAKRGKLAQERGRQILAAAKERAKNAGVASPEALQRHGGLVETLSELEGGIRLLVLGRRGEAADVAKEHLGSHLERVIRAMSRPILVTTAEFRAPQKIMLAFDGSATTRKGVDMVAASPLFKGLPCHLVMVGPDTAEARAQLERARLRLESAGFETPAVILPGEASSVLSQYQQEHGIDLMIMGAYGHSRIRQLLIGSTTTEMMLKSTVPLLLLR
ncbi:Nucleotide-binding universal stress protein, UspA family [Geoalkalibacter ferrihydriticus]|uniref:Universal stress protein UspA n=2 Tax=Geoalkalibacter ferrihydriticus TaxID=392333 RepID=A0A0C2HMP1_9BACT|nr:universal stress protein [Geoalkalibacter ferrihydriticus]KIH76190.1 universal stress protein UspA [Geoalkalibacter ferrihydriticus DSM 17813]SDL28084.1 Nucleotide-binding universal stress protein, UspA family [Geoalkalibacter ferrihydriticus]